MGIGDYLGAAAGYLTGAGPLATAAGYASQHAGQVGGWLKDAGLDGASSSDQAKIAALNAQGGAAGQFADQNQAAFGQLGAQGQQGLDYLRQQMMGGNSVSAMQLAQGQQANAARQQSMAAGAAPQNAAMAARTAMNNVNSGNVGLAGQQALAGLQERNQAASQYGNLLTGLRGQDLTGADAARQNAIGAYSGGLNSQRDPTLAQQWMPAISGAAQALSDERLKEDIQPGDALKLDALHSFTYAYKDEKHGEAGGGRYGGIMAQDLERAGSRAVVNTREGKAVNGARLATELAGSMAQVNARLKALEGK